MPYLSILHNIFRWNAPFLAMAMLAATDFHNLAVDTKITFPEQCSGNSVPMHAFPSTLVTGDMPKSPAQVSGHERHAHEIHMLFKITLSSVNSQFINCMGMPF